MTNYIESPSYKLEKLVEKKIKNFKSYKENPKANPSAIKIMEEEIRELSEILGQIKQLEPTDMMADIASTIKRDTLLDVDIAVLVIPLRPNIPPYEDAKAVIDDLTSCNIPDTLALLEMHREGKACIEVDDYTGNNINNVLDLYSNRGELYKDYKERRGYVHGN